MLVRSSALKASIGALALLAGTAPVVNAATWPHSAPAAASCLRVSGHVPVPSSVETFPRATAVNPITGTLYVADDTDAYQTSVIYVINAKTNTVTTTIPVSDDIFKMAVDTKTNTIYAVASPSKLLVIDGQTNTITATMDLGTWPSNIALDPVTHQMFVINRLNNTHQTNLLILRSPSYSKVVKTIRVGLQGYQLTVDTKTNRVYVPTSDGPNQAVVINGQTKTVIATITGVVNGPIVADSATNTIYAEGGGGGVVAIDGATNAISSTIPVPGAFEVIDLAVNQADGHLYVGTDGGSDDIVGQLSVIDTQTGTVTASIRVGENPTGLSVDPRTHEIYAIVGTNTVRASAVTSVHDSCN